jgi:hypothetical protein
MVLATRTRVLATVYKTVVLDWELGNSRVQLGPKLGLFAPISGVSLL